MKKLILISSILLPLLSTPALAEMRDLKLPVDSGNGCKMNIWVEFQENKNRYCDLVVETCIINADKTKSVGISNCGIDQNQAKGVYDSLKKQ